ncbi:HAD-like protein [Aureobasidium pullulans]|uniref:HAD-like protein n=1 Tax=Aureobasidium pullulans TaxID=5580 RepID=A0AB74K6I3_AURPU|nr:HAD-like protein [Aureobasidium pullulans]
MNLFLRSRTFTAKALSYATVRTFAMENQYPARRFAPLSKGKGHDVVDGSMVLKGIVFDVDGTLCEPQNYMFSLMRKNLNISAGQDILDHVYSLPEAEQKEAHRKIEEVESDAMKKQIPQAGLVTLMEHLDANDIKKGICTRNFNTPVEHLLTNHMPGHINAFAPIVTRDFRPPKPSPAGILHIAKQWGIISESDVADNGRPVAKRPLPLIMVGDSIDDIIAGHDAGAATVLLRSEGKEDLEKDPRTDLVISRLDELIDVLEKGFESRQR